MRILAAAGIAFLIASPAFASPVVSADEAEAMQSEALADIAPERMQGRFEFMREDPDMVVDQLNGRGSGDPLDDCAQTPVRVQRSDGTTVIKRVDVCD
jgi:hypothetical protein